jgi:hypothetical protein
MNVIQHQNVRINDKAIPVPIVFDPLEVVDPVAIVAKNLLALIATDDDMVKCPFELHSRFPCHGGAIYRALEHKSRLRPDPGHCIANLTGHRSNQRIATYRDYLGYAALRN